MFGLRHSAGCDRKVVIKRRGPARVEQCCPEPTFCSAWRPELSPHPQLVPWRRAQRAGCACVTKPHEKSAVHKRLHQGGADGNLSLSFPSLSLSLSLFTPAWLQDQRSIYRLVIFSVPSLSSLPLFLPFLTLPGHSTAVLFSSTLSPEMCCGSGEHVAVCCGL